MPYGWRLLPTNLGEADSFCLPRKGGDANVRDLGAFAPFRKLHYCFADLHRQSKKKELTALADNLAVSSF